MQNTPLYEHTPAETNFLLRPAVYTALAVQIVMIIHSIWYEDNPQDHFLALIIVIVAICSIILFYFTLFEKLIKSSALQIGLVVFVGIFTGVLLSIPCPVIRLLAQADVIIFLVAGSTFTSRRFNYLFPIMTGLAFLIRSALVEQITVQDLSLVLFVLMVSIVVLEIVHRMRHALTQQLRRTESMNMVAAKLSSSLEIEDVVALLGEAIRGALPADTYYVGRLISDHVHLDLLFDEGRFYPAADLPLVETLAGRVVTSRQPLLLTDLPKQHKKLGIRVGLVGNQRPSTSWLGVPILIDNEVFGMIGVASYKHDAFNLRDQELLENIAHQAALAIDNARHHAEVERQSRHDSLTGALNHGWFLKMLAAAAASCQEQGSPLSLIMLDVDHFKQYNDRYGHLLGDQVLTTLVQTIQQHIKSSDLTGRWGGEEFIIALPDTTLPQAQIVATRIRQTLAEIVLTDRYGASIPAPTISQGIAILPDDTDEIFQLIDRADQRLYIAKARGRDQIEPAVSE